MIMLVTEQRDLLKNSIPDFSITPLIMPLQPVSSKVAEELFLARFHQLTQK